MKIIKKQTGIVEVTDVGVILQTLQPVASLSLVDGNDGVRATDVNGRIFDFFTRSIDQLQIDPAAPTQFAGDTQDLIEVLEADFFNSVPSGGGGGGDNIYTVDGNVTDGVRSITGDGTNVLVFDQFAAFGNIAASGSQFVVQQEITLDSVEAINLISTIRASIKSKIAGIEFTEFSDTVNSQRLSKVIRLNTQPAAVYETDDYVWLNTLDNSVNYWNSSTSQWVNLITEDTVINSATAPVNTSKLWFKTKNQDNQLYYFDTTTSSWLTTQKFSLKFADRGNTPANAFLRFENTNTSLTIGAPVAQDIVIQQIETVNNANLTGETVNIFANGLPVASEVISSNKVGIADISPVPVSAGSFLSISKGGGANNNFIAIIYFRKVSV